MQTAGDAEDANAAVQAITGKFLPREADNVQDASQMILVLREDLSYTTGRPQWENRFMSITRIQVRPGHEAEFVEARGAVKAAHEKAALPDGFAIYRVTDGMPGGTWYQLAGRKSLAELDDAAKTHADPAYLASLGADWPKRSAALAQAYEMTTEANLFSMSPGMSIVPKEWSAADSFWKPKAPPKKAP